MKSVACIVPARMASSRFPGKPLAMIAGEIMVTRVLKQAQKAKCFDRIVCATDHIDIAKAVEQAGFEAVLTKEHFTGTDRVAEAAQLLHLDLVVNLQGDEPLMSPILLETIAANLVQDPTSWITAYSPLSESANQNRSCVKVLNKNECALDFTRDVVSGDSWFHHRGIYAYSLNSLQHFLQTPQTPQEMERSIEPLRIVGSKKIRLCASAEYAPSVDHPSDIAIIEDLLLRNAS